MDLLQRIAWNELQDQPAGNYYIYDKNVRATVESNGTDRIWKIYQSDYTTLYNVNVNELDPVDYNPGIYLIIGEPLQLSLNHKVQVQGISATNLNEYQTRYLVRANKVLLDDNAIVDESLINTNSNDKNLFITYSNGQIDPYGSVFVYRKNNKLYANCVFSNSFPGVKSSSFLTYKSLIKQTPTAIKIFYNDGTQFYEISGGGGSVEPTPDNYVILYGVHTAYENIDYNSNSQQGNIQIRGFVEGKIDGGEW